MIDSIIFDADGVVIDTEEIWDREQEEFLRRRGFVYDRPRIKPLMTGTSLLDGAMVLAREYGFPGDPQSLARERLEIVHDLYERDVKFMDGFLEFFDRVRGRNKTCVATAMPREVLEIADRRLGLSELFGGHLYCIADVGNRAKPDPDLFLYAARQLGSGPESCVVIEDSPLGVEAARRAEMKSIGLARTYDRQTLRAADLVVDSFSEIDLDRAIGLDSV
jgi:beta-phosphoglucomutase